MTTSTTYGFNPRLADHLDEAFERCGINPAELKGRHLKSAIRSSNLVFSEWQNFGYKQHTLAFFSRSLTTNNAIYTLPTGGIDIFHATLKRDGRESEMYSLSRSDYNALHDKTTTGRPDRYFVDRGTFIGDTPASTFTLWQVPENSTDTMEIWYIRKIKDSGTMSNTLDIPSAYQEAFSCGLAYHLSRKFAPERARTLKNDYLGENYDDSAHNMPGGAMGRALAQDRDTGDAVLRVRFDRQRGR